jgi:hypothetical protein
MIITFHKSFLQDGARLLAIGFNLLYVLVIASLARRQLVRIGVPCAPERRMNFAAN